MANVGNFGLADNENFKRTFQLTTVNDEFPVDHQNGINKPSIRLIMLLKCKKTNKTHGPRGSTLNQNRNSDVGNNQGHLKSLNMPTSRTDT